jgi:hypothetical protein
MEDAMRKITTLAALLGFMALSAPAFADDQPNSPSALTGNPVTLEVMRQKIDALGYDVRRLKAEHGRFEALIVDRQTGGLVEAVFSAWDGELVRAKLEI